MIIRAHAKVNWSLAVTGLREDGYHLVDMILERIALCDDLEILPAPALSLRLDGESDFPVAADDSNLILRAARALRERIGGGDGAQITLKKRIPLGAGLGGGSADAAATLLGLNTLWHGGLGLRELEELALPLGADIPFCLHREPMRVRGIGEELTPLPPLPRRHLVILKGPEGLDTGSVYRLYGRCGEQADYDHDRALEALLSPAGDLGKHLVNMLEAPARALCPRIGEDLARLRSAGAAFAQMTGSGSAVYGVFADEAAAQKALKLLKKQDRDGVCILTSTL